MKRTLIIFGMFWLLVFGAYGLYMGFQDDIHEEQMEALAEAGNLESFWEAWEGWKVLANAHAHALGFAILALLFGLAFEEIHLSDKLKQIMGLLLIVGSIVSSVFQVFYSENLLGLGHLLVFFAIVLVFVGAIKKAS